MHKNARLTPKGRGVMVGRLEADQHQQDVAQAMGVSRTTLRTWLRRYRAQGTVGLFDRSCRARHSPRQLVPTIVTEITVLRRQRRTGRYIARQLRVSAASVSRVLRRAHLSRWPELEPQPAVQRYERQNPGELLHLDIKKLGRILQVGTGRRLQPSAFIAMFRKALGRTPRAYFSAVARP